MITPIKNQSYNWNTLISKGRYYKQEKAANRYSFKKEISKMKSARIEKEHRKQDKP